MKDSVEIVSSILGIVISCITIYQFFVQRPSVARLHREKTAHMSQELHPVPTGTEASAAMSPVSDEVEHAHTRKYLLALATFIVMPIVAFFLLYFYALWSQYSYSSQEALIANSGGALLAGSSLALMILLLAPSRQRAIVAEITFAIIYSLVLLGVILLNATIYFSFFLYNVFYSYMVRRIFSSERHRQAYMKTSFLVVLAGASRGFLLKQTIT